MIEIAALFEYGTMAKYCAGNKEIDCRVFLDVGQSDVLSDYHSQMRGVVTLATVLLSEVNPAAGDIIKVANKSYVVAGILAKDNLMASLTLEKYEAT